MTAQPTESIVPADHDANALRPWTGDRDAGSLGSNVASKQLPFQSWRPFKEAFAPEIVSRAISETQGDVQRVVDPFGGSGTTALASQFMGRKATTIEVNPFLADLIEAKLVSYDVGSLTHGYACVMKALHGVPRVKTRSFGTLPPTFLEPGVKGRYLFSTPVAEHLERLLDAIDTHCDLHTRRLFRVLYAAVALEASNVVISGKGRRYRRKWQERMVTPQKISAHFSEKALSAIGDICRHSMRDEPGYHLLRGDSRACLKDIGEQDVAVFSPPYPNSFDYTDVYNVELWLLGYLRDASSNGLLRAETLRSHVQTKRAYEDDTSLSELLSDVYGQLRNSRAKLWNRDIPEMIVAYFADMRGVLSQLAGKLRPAGRIYCVVGDSQYAGIGVPVAAILAELAAACGLVHLYKEEFRSMRASPQQGGDFRLQESLLVFEKA